MKKKVLKAFTLILLISLPLGTVFASGTAGDNGGSKDDLSETLDIEVLAYSENVPAPDSAMIPALEEALNINLTYSQAFYWEMTGARDARIAAGDVPDLYFVTAAARNQEMDLLVEDGFALELTDKISDYPNLKKHVDGLDFVDELFGYDGKMFSIPNYFGTTDIIVLQRRDWREQLGLAMPDNWDEFEHMMRKFVAEIPGAEYASQWPGMEMEYSYMGYAVTSSAQGASNFAKVDGEWLHRFEIPGFKEATRRRVSWYEEGLNSREGQRGAGWQNDFITGIAGIGFTQGIQLGWDEVVLPLMELDPDADVEALAPAPKGPKGRIWFRTYGYQAYSVVSAKSEEKIQDRVLAMVDYLYSPEGVELGVWGVEGVHYDWDNGKRVRNPDTFPWDYNDASGTWSFLNYIGGNFAASNEIAHPEIQVNIENCATYGEPLRGSLRAPADQADYYQLLWNQMNEVIWKWDTAWMQGEKSVDSEDDWNEMMAELEKAGLNEYKEALDKWGNWIN